MKYELMLRCVPDEKQSIQERHAEVVRLLDQIPAPWGFGGKGGPPVPDVGRELLVECRLDSFLDRGVRGSLVYRYRGGLADAGMYDDYLRLQFNSARVDYPTVVHSVLPQLIKGLRPYRAHVGPEQLMVIDFDVMRRNDYRNGVHRFYPVTYLGRRVCLQALSCTPEDLVRRMARACASAEMLGDGAFLVATVEAVATDGAEAVNARMWACLRQQDTPQDLSRH